MRITLIGGPMHEREMEIGSGTHVCMVHYTIPFGSKDEMNGGKIIDLSYIKVPGQDKYFIFEPYYKAPEL